MTAPDGPSPADATQPVGVVDPATPTTADPPSPRRWSGRRRRAALVAAGLFLLLGAAYGVDLLVTSGDVVRGTTVLGVPIGGLTEAEAVATLQKELGDTLDRPIAAEVAGVEVSIDPAAAGLSIDWVATVATNLDQPLSPIGRVAGLLGRDRPVRPAVTVDAAKAAAALAAVAKQVDQPATEASITYDGTTPAVKPGVGGQAVDVAKATAVLRSSWPSGDRTQLPVTAAAPTVTAAGLTAATKVAGWLVAGPLTVTGEGGTASLTPAQVVTTVTFVPDGTGSLVPKVDPKALSAAAGPALAPTQTAPKDAAFTFTDSAVTIVPSADGRIVDWTKTALALAAAAPTTPSERTAAAAYVLSPPAQTTAALEKLGVTEVVSEFTTSGFASDSGQNIKVTAEKVNGALVKPGETFSLNTFTGPRGAAQGYVPAGAIINGQPGKAIGGGISQFATTLYNAYYYAGLVDVTHKPHSYYISRYPAGRDATVFDGQIDVAFANDAATGILIQTIWTPNDITVRFWGTKYYTVEAVAGERYGYTGAPQKTIPYGEPCSASGGSGGFSIDVTRVVTDVATGKVIKQDSYTTTYVGQVKVICAPPPATPPPSPPPPAPPGG